MKKDIILVLGPICSGKTTYCQSFCYAAPDTKYIKVSDIVRQLSKKAVRSEMQQTSHLDAEISAALIHAIDDALSSELYNSIIIDGIRQLSIVRMLIAYFGMERITMHWLEVPYDIRKARYNSLSRQRDDLSFEEATDRDSKLGLEELENVLSTLFHIIKLDNHNDNSN